MNLALEINLKDTIEETMDELFCKMYKILEENTKNRYGGDIGFSEVFELDEIKKEIYDLFLKVSSHNVVEEPWRNSKEYFMLLDYLNINSPYVTHIGLISKSNDCMVFEITEHYTAKYNLTVKNGRLYDKAGNDMLIRAKECFEEEDIIKEINKFEEKWCQKGSSFVDDEEKMIDLFVLSKQAFLEFYSYLTEKDYEETERDVIKKSGYWNEEWVDNNPDYDGRELKDICLGIMITEWLGKRGK